MSWFYSQQVKAYLSLANNSAALLLLQKLLWNTDEYTASDSIATWRRLVIRSYLQMGKIEDAQRAMRRYQQDYGSLENEDGLQWTVFTDAVVDANPTLSGSDSISIFCQQR